MSLQPATGREDFCEAEVLQLLTTQYGLDFSSNDGSPRVYELYGFEDRNFMVKAPQKADEGVSSDGMNLKILPEELILKVFCSGHDSKRIQAINDILVHAESCGVKCSRPVPNLEGRTVTLVLPVPTREEHDNTSTSSTLCSPTKSVVAGARTTSYSQQSVCVSTRHDGPAQSTCSYTNLRTAVVMEFIAGKTIRRCHLFSQSDPSPTDLNHFDELMYDVGRCCGDLQRALQSTPESVVDVIRSQPTDEWNLLKLPSLRYLLPVSELSEELYQLCSDVIDMYETEIMPAAEAGKLRSGLVHADVNPSNVLVTEEELDKPCITGVIDFTDCVYSYSVFELSTCAAYFSIHLKYSLRTCAQVVRGFQEVFPLTASEQLAVFPMVCAQLAMVLLLVKKQLRADPACDVSDLIEPATSTLTTFWRANRHDAEREWFGGA